MKFSLYQAQEYFDIFKRFANDELIPSNKAKEIFVVNIKLRPDMVPHKWTTYSLNFIDEVILNLSDEETGLINWRHLISY